MTDAKKLMINNHCYSAVFNLFAAILMVASTLRLNAFEGSTFLTYTGFGLAALAVALLGRNLFYIYRIWRAAREE